MSRPLTILAMFMLPAAVAPAASLPNPCEGAIAAAERVANTAPGLLRAIGLVESGRRDLAAGERRPWPWTVTAEGVGIYYPTKADAILAVQALLERGITSIDVGCMQVNLLYHPTAFRSLEQAFDPGPNAGYAARFLSSLHTKLGNWPDSAAAYHSFTPGPAAQYARLIAAVWSGGPVPVIDAPGGEEIVQFPGGGEMRTFRSADAQGRDRVFGLLH